MNQVEILNYLESSVHYFIPAQVFEVDSFLLWFTLCKYCCEKGFLENSSLYAMHDGKHIV